MEEEFTSNRVISPKMPVKEINIKDLLAVIKRRLWIIILTTLLFALLGGLYSSIPEPPIYAASSRVIIAEKDPDLSSTLKVFIREPVVLDRVIEELNLRQSAASLRNQINVTSIDNSYITLVTALDVNPRRAVEISNAVVNAYKREALDRLNFSGIKVLTNAEDTNHPIPINPKSNRALIAGTLAGIVIGIGLVFLADSLDNSIRTRQDIERLLDMNLLGEVKKISMKDLSGATRQNKEYIRGETIGS